MIEPIELGWCTLTPWYIANVIAIAVAGWLSVERLRRAGFPAAFVTQGVAITIIFGVGGTAVAYRLVGLLDGYLKTGVWQATVSGSTIVGALVGGSLTGYAFCRWKGYDPGRAFDAGIVPVPLGQAIGRIGCFLSPCCCGRSTNSWLGMNLPDGAGFWTHRYPSQLFASFFDLAIFVTLIAVQRRAHGRYGPPPRLPFPGFILLLYLGLYSCKRFLLEFTRMEPKWWGPLSWAQLASLFGITVICVLMVANLRRARRRRGTNE